MNNSIQLMVNNIVDLAVQHNVKLNDLCRYANIDVSTLTRWRSGYIKEPSLSKFIRLQAALDRLLELQGSMRGRDYPN